MNWQVTCKLPFVVFNKAMQTLTDLWLNLFKLYPFQYRGHIWKFIDNLFSCQQLSCNLFVNVCHNTYIWIPISKYVQFNILFLSNKTLLISRQWGCYVVENCSPVESYGILRLYTISSTMGWQMCWVVHKYHEHYWSLMKGILRNMKGILFSANIVSQQPACFVLRNRCFRLLVNFTFSGL